MGKGATSDAHPERTTARQRLGLLLLNGYLFSPVAIQICLGGRQGLKDPLLWFVVAQSLMWLALGHVSVRRPLWLHLAILPLYLTTATDLFLLLAFGARLSSGYVGVALSNQGELSEFVAAFWHELLIIAVLLAAIYGFGLYCIRGLRRRRTSRRALAIAALVAALYAVAIGWSARGGMGLRPALADVATHETSAPMGAVFQIGVALDQHLEFLDAIRMRSRYSFHAAMQPSTHDEVYVWVIGESSRPQNWSLFGYPRETTPRLDRTPGIIAFPDMMSTAPHTSVAVPSMLSLRGIDDWQAVLREPSIVTAFNEVGFATYWLSAQEADGWAGIIPQIAVVAGAVRYFTHTPDGRLADELHDILERPHAVPRRLFIVLHTRGSHFDYSRRYPPGFARFRAPGGSRRDQIVDAYDNSVLYTDWLLARIISMLQHADAEAVLLYASDHGENLLDDDRGLLGHAVGSRYDLASAAFLWLSEPWRARHADLAANVRAHAAAPLSLSNLSPMLLQLAGISTPALDARRSVADGAFSPTTRFYVVRGELHTAQ